MYTLDEIKNRILQGDSLTVLKTLPSESVDCIITSPPYYNLRDYKVDGQLGHESTVQEYIEKLVSIFDECKRVLKSSGTCWVVMGDSYNVNKSLSLVPDRFAIEMTNRHWILRNTIIWFKSNCMPSSAKDRFTVDYENVYFFTKSQRYYFKTQYEPYDIKENGWAKQRLRGINNLTNRKKQGLEPCAWTSMNIQENIYGRIKRCVWKISTKPFPEAHFAVFPEELVKQCLDAGCPPNGVTLDMFMGSGTTALVALKNAMNFVGIELNPDYIKMAMKRIEPYLKQEKLTQFTAK